MFDATFDLFGTFSNVLNLQCITYRTNARGIKWHQVWNDFNNSIAFKVWTSKILQIDNIYWLGLKYWRHDVWKNILYDNNYGICNLQRPSEIDISAQNP